ncbi:MAG: tetratricopeptide repeat protein [Bacteroidota bacterium]
MRIITLMGAWWFCIVGPLYAQNKMIDSLTRAVREEKNPVQKVELLNTLVAQTWDYNFEKGLELAEQAYTLARQTNDPRNLAFSATSVGMYHYFKADYPTALRYYWQALHYAAGRTYGDIPAYTHIRLGNLYRVTGMFDSSRWYYEAALRSLSGQPEEATHSSAYYNLGQLEMETGNYTEAVRYTQKALTVRTHLGDSLLMAECWRALGNIAKNLGNYQEARGHFVNIQQVGNRFHDPELQMFASIHLGEVDFLEGDLVGAMGHLGNGLEQLKKHDFKRYHAQVLTVMGRVFEALGDYDRALESFVNALKIDEEIGSRQMAARTHGLMAWVHIRQRNDSIASAFARRSLSLCTQLKDREGIAFANNMLGYIHYVNFRNDSALHYFQKAYQARSALGLVVLSANTLFNMARVYARQGNYEKANEAFLAVLKVDRGRNNRGGAVGTLNALGETALAMKNYPLASSYLKQAEAEAEQLLNKNEQRNNYRLQAKWAKATNQPGLANDYYEKYIALSDSLYSNESNTKIAQIHALYQLDKKEQEIERLSTANQLAQNQLLIQQSQLRWQSAVTIGSVVGGVFLLALAFVLYRYYQEKSEMADELAELNREIQEKKEEVEVQAEELKESNERLLRLNREVTEQWEEIQAQSEELIEANQAIQNINRNLETAVEERTAQLKEAYRELDTFFYRASHDFRRPLTTFMGLSEVANMTVKDPAALELFSKVKETARNLDKMLSKLQSVSAVGAAETVFRQIHFQTELDYVFDTFKEELLAKGIDFRTEVNSNRKFKSYPAILRIILSNLVENAIHFASPSNPIIAIIIEDGPHGVIITVRDNGEGIRPEYLDKVFEMYFRASEKSKGNGLGLYIVKKSVEKLNGTIQLESTHNHGTTIRVVLPFT